MELPEEVANRVERLSYAMEGLSDVLYVPAGGQETPLKEGRYLIVRQMNAISGVMQQWNRRGFCEEDGYAYKRAALIYQAGERGLLIKEIRVLEEAKRITIEALASSKWNRGIPSRILLQLAEKVFGRSMRLGKDTKNIRTKTPTKVVLYEALNFTLFI